MTEIKAEPLTRGIKNCRNSRLFKVCSPLQLLCNWIGNRPQSATFHTANVSTNFMTDDTMKEKINEEVLCVLRKDNSNHIFIGYVDIINPFKTNVEKLSELCDKPETTIQQVVSYIQSTKDFEQLSAHYRYCVSLRNAYQGFTANNQEFIKEINQRHQLFLFNKKENPDTYNLEEAIEGLKSEIKDKYLLWSKAFAINKTYRLCHEDKSILTFSHRIDGGPNPV